MKKFMYSALLAGTFLITACGSDDDGGESGCAVCESTAGEITIKSTVCDAGDGNVTITLEGGAEQTISISPATFDQYIESISVDPNTTCTR